MLTAPSIIIEETFEASLEKIWKAITDKNEMKEWYFPLEAFNPVVGFEFEFGGIGSTGDEYIHLCKITEAIKEKKLAYSWCYRDYPGNSEVSFELFKTGNLSTVRLTHAGVESFANPNPDFSRESFVKGWTEIIKKLLKNYLDNA